MSTSHKAERELVSRLRNIDESFKENPALENTQFADHYVTQRRETILELLIQSYPGSNRVLCEKILSVLQRSHYKRDYSTELITEFVRNKSCHSRTESILKTLTLAFQSSEEINKTLDQFCQQELAPIETAIQTVKLREIGFTRLASLWESIIILQTNLSTLRNRLDHELQALEDGITAMKRDLEKFREAYNYGEEFVKTIEPLYDTSFLEKVRVRFDTIWDLVKDLRTQLQEILDYVSARTAVGIQRETTLLNILFLMAAIAGLIALMPFGWYAMLPPVLLAPIIFLIVRWIYHRKR